MKGRDLKSTPLSEKILKICTMPGFSFEVIACSELLVHKQEYLISKNPLSQEELPKYNVCWKKGTHEPFFLKVVGHTIEQVTVYRVLHLA